MTTQVLVPPLGQTVDTVILTTWYKQEGDAVRQGEPLFAIETDKAVLDIEAPAAGILRRVTAQAGDEVKALSAIALIAAEGEQVGAEGPVRPGAPGSPPVSTDARLPAEGQRDRGAREPLRSGALQRIFISPRARRLAEQERVPLDELTATGPEGAIIERDVRARLQAIVAKQAGPAITPVARRIAEEAGLDWKALAGSGPRGQVVRQDVDRALAAGAAVAPEAPAPLPGPRPPAEAFETIPLAGTRAVIAERMLHSASATAPVTLTAEADATALVKLRKNLAEDGIAATYNDLFVYILGHALAEHPRLNASLDGQAIKLWHQVHIGLAVDTERGLLVPVIHDVQSMSLAEIAHDAARLVERARGGRCTPDELRGGTFTLTTLGSLGIDAFTPIINLPECAILGVGRIKPQPVIRRKKVVARQMVWLSLTFDHRLVDGAPAARFLQRVVQLVERPHLLLA